MSLTKMALLRTNAPVSRFGFAYGTPLGSIPRGGEGERFTVKWDRTSDNVFYDILAFSRPRHTLAKLAYPLSRSLQRAFADCSSGNVYRRNRRPPMSFSSADGLLPHPGSERDSFHVSSVRVAIRRKLLALFHRNVVIAGDLSQRAALPC